MKPTERRPRPIVSARSAEDRSEAPGGAPEGARPWVERVGEARGRGGQWQCRQLADERDVELREVRLERAVEMRRVGRAVREHGLAVDDEAGRTEHVFEQRRQLAGRLRLLCLRPARQHERRAQRHDRESMASWRVLARSGDEWARQSSSARLLESHGFDDPAAIGSTQLERPAGVAAQLMAIHRRERIASRGDDRCGVARHLDARRVERDADLARVAEFRLDGSLLRAAEPGPDLLQGWQAACLERRRVLLQRAADGVLRIGSAPLRGNRRRRRAGRRRCRRWVPESACTFGSGASAAVRRAWDVRAGGGGSAAARVSARPTDSAAAASNRPCAWYAAVVALA